MPRSCKAILSCVFLVSFLAILTVDAPAQADTTFQFNATSCDATYISDFSLRYVDADMSQRFSIAELVPGSFSGVDYRGPYLPDGRFFEFVVGVPEYDGACQLTDGNAYRIWIFSEGLGGGWEFPNVELWTYSQVVVPLPASVFLLGAGLIGLAVARRRKRLG